MKILKSFLAMTFLSVLCIANLQAENVLKASGETEYFKFTVEFKDSTFLFQYKDSLNLIRERSEIALLLVFSELMCPTKYRDEADIEGFKPTYAKIRALEAKLIDEPSPDEKESIVKARNALAKVYNMLYKIYQFDWIGEKWRGK